MMTKTFVESKNKRNKKDVKNDASKALNNPHLTRSKGSLEEGDNAMSPQITEVIEPQPFQGDEICLCAHLTEAIALNAGLTSPMMVSTTMLGGDAPFILFGRNDTQDGAVWTQLEEDMPQGMSTLMCEAH